MPMSGIHRLRERVRINNLKDRMLATNCVIN